MSKITRMGLVRTTTMEPLLDGDFREKTITKYSYRCDGLNCGLIWTRKHEASDCAARKHVVTFTQRYVTGPIINGIPRYERFYPRNAIGRNDAFGFTYEGDDETDMPERGKNNA